MVVAHPERSALMITRIKLIEIMPAAPRDAAVL